MYVRGVCARSRGPYRFLIGKDRTCSKKDRRGIYSRDGPDSPPELDFRERACRIRVASCLRPSRWPADASDLAARRAHLLNNLLIHSLTSLLTYYTRYTIHTHFAQ